MGHDALEFLGARERASLHVNFGDSRSANPRRAGGPIHSYILITGEIRFLYSSQVFSQWPQLGS